MNAFKYISAAMVLALFALCNSDRTAPNDILYTYEFDLGNGNHDLSFIIRTDQESWLNDEDYPIGKINTNLYILNADNYGQIYFNVSFLLKPSLQIILHNTIVNNADLIITGDFGPKKYPLERLSQCQEIIVLITYVPTSSNTHLTLWSKPNVSLDLLRKFVESIDYVIVEEEPYDKNSWRLFIKPALSYKAEILNTIIFNPHILHVSYPFPYPQGG